MRKLILGILFLFILKLGFSQKPEKFSDTREGYFQEISAMLLSTKSKLYQKKSEKLLEGFGPKWVSERFSPEEKDEIIIASNILLEKKIRVFPEFYHFMEALNALAYSRQAKRGVIAWLRSLEPIPLKKSAKGFNKYLDFSIALFSDHILYNTRTLAWKFDKADYVFEFDSVPILNFEKLDLICSTRKDSAVIVGTKGSYDINNFVWRGEGGTIDWRRVGLGKDEVYAEILSSYQAVLTETDFDVDSVRFFNKKYFHHPIYGSLSEKVLSSPPNHRTSYPRFESFQKSYEMKDVFENVDFVGGFAMEGPKLLGAGGKNKMASLSFYRNDTLYAFMEAKTFQFQADKIVSNRSSIAIYYEKDSIYHPGLNMKFSDKDKMLNLYRSSRGLSKSPFYDSYHQLDMFCEAMYWNTQKGEISFESIRGLSSKSKAMFESANYYADHDYYKLQGIDPINPLDLVKNYARRYKIDYIRVGAFAEYLDKPVEQIKAMFFNLASQGFLVFDVEDGKATIKDRLYYYLDAKAGTTDYDVIRFGSHTVLESNAKLNLMNFDLTINGVPEVFLSDSQGVYIYPKDGQIIMKKNRDFVFSGVVKAGLFDFYARDCSFEYDTFRLNLPVIDSLSFMVRAADTADQMGRPIYVRVKNVIARLSGDILIDHPQNKAGLKSFPKFPVFNSKNDSYVFYDYYTIQEGAYDKDRFYYYVDPFVIEKLDNFSTDDLKFTGYLASDGIFPNIDKPLVVLPDYSLGFVTQTPQNGLPVYNKTGQFYDKITLNNDGLIGEGKLHYLTSTSTSAEFVFYLDSLKSVAATFDVEARLEGVEFPEATSKVVNQFWKTDTNIMIVGMIDEPFGMYGNNSVLKGEMELSPKGMKGKGIFDFTNAEIISDQFNFYHHSLSADTSDFRLLTANTGDLAISTEDYKTFIDFDKRIGNFSSLGRNSLIEFPVNQYISSMDKMVWRMDDKKIEMRNEMAKKIPYLEELNLYDLIDFDFSGSEFISTHPKQDSLAFFSQKAVYDMIDYTISAEGVKIIKVADAAIYPGDGDVEILRDAALKTLNDAYIIADTASKYHTFYNATVNIFGRHNYLAKGSYDYIDQNNTPQEIQMNYISVDTLGVTEAIGSVPMSTVFFLSPNYLFTGDVFITSPRKNLEFDGGYRINQDCYYYDQDWVKFDTVVNPLEVVLPAPHKMYDLDMRSLRVGLYHSSLESKIYPVFFTSKENVADTFMFQAEGVVSYNANLQEFRVGGYDRIKYKSQEGNYFNLSTIPCVLKGIGDMNLGVDLQSVVMAPFGKVEYLLIPDSTKLNISLMLDFFFNEKLMELFADSLAASNQPGIDLGKETYKLTLINLLGQEKADELMEELNLYGSIKRLPDELEHSMVLSDVNFIWNPETASYISRGEIGVGSVIKTQINKSLKGYIEIERKRAGDAIHLYLEASDKNWYFFSYRGGVMQAISSDETFNTKLTELKDDDRKVRIPGSDLNYEYVISTRKKQVDFVRRMEALR
jgi:hypothetical protein